MARAADRGAARWSKRGIDFSDEGDVPENLARPALAHRRPVADEIGQAWRAATASACAKGCVVAIAGPPNVGKSTLLNRIARREAAIVSPHAGTTRDVIEVHLDLGGFPVTLLDTAGIRETDDPVEQEGVRRARQAATAADLVLWVLDVREIGPDLATKVPAWPRRCTWRVWFLVNKIDLVGRMPEELNPGSAAHPRARDLSDFGDDRRGHRRADRRASAEFAAVVFRAGEPVLVTRERHRQMLRWRAVRWLGARAATRLTARKAGRRSSPSSCGWRRGRSGG